MSDDARNAHLDWLDKCAKEDEEFARDRAAFNVLDDKTKRLIDEVWFERLEEEGEDG